MRPLTGEQRRLADQNVNVARWVSWKSRMSVDDPADVESDAMWGLTQAARRWKPGSLSFARYATMACEHAIRNGRRDRSELPRGLWEAGERQRPVSSLDKPIFGELGDPTTPGDLLPSTALPTDVTVALRQALRTLTSRQRRAVILQEVCGIPQDDIAEIEGHTQMTVSRDYRNALARLRAALPPL